MTTCLVTAIGGDVGQAVARCLRRAGHRVVGADADTLHIWTVGPFADAWFHRLPPAADPLYLPTLTSIVAERNIHLVFPCSEQELSCVTAPYIENARIVRCWPAPTAEALADKALCMEKLDRVGVRVPWPEASAQLFTKPRRKHSPEFVEQRRLFGPEFTVAVYGSETGDIRMLAMRRELRGGASHRIWVDPENSEHKKAAHTGRRIAEAFGLVGSFNVQLMFDSDGEPCVFEINPRFSSTASMRALVGFPDVEWAVAEALELPLPPALPIHRTRVVRYWEEACVDR